MRHLTDLNLTADSRFTVSLSPRLMKNAFRQISSFYSRDSLRKMLSRKGPILGDHITLKEQTNAKEPFHQGADYRDAPDPSYLGQSRPSYPTFFA